MKKIIPVLTAAVILLTGCAAVTGRHEPETDAVSGKASDIDMEIYLYDDVWEPLSGAVMELYTETTELGAARPAYSATADDMGMLKIRSVAREQNYIVEVKERDGEIEATGAIYISAGDVVNHTNDMGYMEIQIPESSAKVYLTIAEQDDKLRCSHSSDKGFDDAEIH